MIKKIKTIGEIEKISRELKNQNEKIVTTNGVFDILHAGHVKYLQSAKSLGDCLIVAINSDSSVKKIKGSKRPLNTEKDRAEIITAMGCVDFVTIFNEEEPSKILDIIKPDVHVKGGDYNKNKMAEKNIVEKNNGKIVLVKFEDGYSTTGIINKILALYGDNKP